ncbi:hypothetical protein FO440_09670 [Mucilaginibacter corticis]|uniref:YtxH domain-containing protein n=1 Tax=Mucilaginibacter corticis TaxID=2597670 RepID=A0A556MX18_9SPHI|nr:hypothetical protein [Mucilaginibacter corticis]TSJ44425.1 hypothetical protein FO440_09670 [Mucilaginibacter corticis]
MKNPFEKENHTTLIVAVSVLAVAAGAAAFLFLTDKGEDTRKSLKKKIKKIAKNAAVEAVHKRTKVSKKALKGVADHVVK